MNVNDTEYRETVYSLVKTIPAGRVMTYGQIAHILGDGYTARTVGYVMHGAQTESVPWQRVINSQGKCSTSKLTIPMDLQQELLAAEGVVFSDRGKCDLNIYLWWPDGQEGEADLQTALFTTP
jgi:methylated-DNA-protein-cysteine methyltransferase related protein